MHKIAKSFQTPSSALSAIILFVGPTWGSSSMCISCSNDRRSKGIGFKFKCALGCHVSPCLRRLFRPTVGKASRKGLNSLFHRRMGCPNLVRKPEHVATEKSYWYVPHLVGTLPALFSEHVDTGTERQRDRETERERASEPAS